MNMGRKELVARSPRGGKGGLWIGHTEVTPRTQEFRRMPSTNVLVITSNDSFAGVIEEVTGAIEGVALGRRRSFEEMGQGAAYPPPNLVIFHVTDGRAGVEIERLQEQLSTSQPPVPLIVVSDHYDA